jgi:hypothetical protein
VQLGLFDYSRKIQTEALPGSRIGLTPPSGMVMSKSFFGYEDPEHNAAIILVALPVQAYSDLSNSERTPDVP